MMKKFIPILLLFIGINTTIFGQFRLPSFDIEAKGGVGGFPNTQWDYLLTNYQTGIHIHINQHLAIGWTYSRGSGTTSRTGNQDIFVNSEKYDTKELITGLDLRLSAGRTKKLRPYIALHYTKVEVVTDLVDYRQSVKTNAIGGSAGLLLKLGNKMYLNLIDITGRYLSEEPFWLNERVHLEFRAGLLYNISRRK